MPILVPQLNAAVNMVNSAKPKYMVLTTITTWYFMQNTEKHEIFKFKEQKPIKALTFFPTKQRNKHNILYGPVLPMFYFTWFIQHASPTYLTVAVWRNKSEINLWFMQTGAAKDRTTNHLISRSFATNYSHRRNLKTVTNLFLPVSSLSSIVTLLGFRPKKRFCGWCTIISSSLIVSSRCSPLW